MKVIVAGFSKTGTKTMNAALSVLGYKVYDYEHNFFYLRKEWIKIMTSGGTKDDFYQMYKDVDATCDIPAVIFWEEIAAAFPEAKIIFMQRKSEEDWLRSWERQANELKNNWLMKGLAFVSYTANSIFCYSRHVGRIAFSAPPQPFWAAFRGISPTVAKKRYRDHNTSVLTRAPEDRLLIFSISDGWDPICKFLGLRVPDIPFPHKNQRGSLVDDYLKHSPIFQQMKKEMYITCAVVCSLCAVGAIYKFMTPSDLTVPTLKFW
ncbi:uncharacterized protein LOC120348116 [Styela clava]